MTSEQLVDFMEMKLNLLTEYIYHMDTIGSTLATVKD